MCHFVGGRAFQQVFGRESLYCGDARLLPVLCFVRPSLLLLGLVLVLLGQLHSSGPDTDPVQ